MRRDRVILLSLLVFVISLTLLPAQVQAQIAEGSMPPEAQTAFDKGSAAAQQQEWSLAIRYFGEAQKAAPLFPPLFVNLGLAHARAGHEFDAIAWLRAYLAAAPTAPNAGAVRNEITKLEVSAEAKIDKVLQTARAAVAAMPDGWNKDKAYASLAIAQAKAGDVAGTNKTVAQIADRVAKAELYSLLAIARARAGDLGGAHESLTRVKETVAQISERSQTAYADLQKVYPDLARAQAALGDTAGATATVGQIFTFDRTTVYKAYLEISDEQLKSGDVGGMRESLKRARETVDFIVEGSGKVDDYMNLVRAQIKAGDVGGARESLARLKVTVAMIADTAEKVNAYSSLLAIAEAEVGDIAGAKETAAPIKDESYKARVYSSIARAQAKVGDIAGAKETAARISYEWGKAEADMAIATAQGGMGGAEIFSWAAIALQLRESGPPVVDNEFLESLKHKTPRETVDALRDAASRWSRILSELRETETYWQKMRAKGARPPQTK